MRNFRIQGAIILALAAMIAIGYQNCGGMKGRKLASLTRDIDLANLSQVANVGISINDGNVTLAPDNVECHVTQGQRFCDSYFKLNGRVTGLATGKMVRLVSSDNRTFACLPNGDYSLNTTNPNDPRFSWVGLQTVTLRAEVVDTANCNSGSAPSDGAGRITLKGVCGNNAAPTGNPPACPAIETSSAGTFQQLDSSTACRIAGRANVTALAPGRVARVYIQNLASPSLSRYTGCIDDITESDTIIFDTEYPGRVKLHLEEAQYCTFGSPLKTLAQTNEFVCDDQTSEPVNAVFSGVSATYIASTNNCSLTGSVAVSGSVPENHFVCTRYYRAPNYEVIGFGRQSYAIPSNSNFRADRGNVSLVAELRLSSCSGTYVRQLSTLNSTCGYTLSGLSVKALKEFNSELLVPGAEATSSQTVMADCPSSESSCRFRVNLSVQGLSSSRWLKATVDGQTLFCSWFGGGNSGVISVPLGGERIIKVENAYSNSTCTEGEIPLLEQDKRTLTIRRPVSTATTTTGSSSSSSSSSTTTSTSRTVTTATGIQGLHPSSFQLIAIDTNGLELPLGPQGQFLSCPMTGAGPCRFKVRSTISGLDGTRAVKITRNGDLLACVGNGTEDSVQISLGPNQSARIQAESSYSNADCTLGVFLMPPNLRKDFTVIGVSSDVGGGTSTSTTTSTSRTTSTTGSQSGIEPTQLTLVAQTPTGTALNFDSTFLVFVCPAASSATSCTFRIQSIISGLSGTRGVKITEGGNLLACVGNGTANSVNVSVPVGARRTIEARYTYSNSTCSEGEVEMSAARQRRFDVGGFGAGTTSTTSTSTTSSTSRTTTTGITSCNSNATVSISATQSGVNIPNNGECTIQSGGVHCRPEPQVRVQVNGTLSGSQEVAVYVDGNTSAPYACLGSNDVDTKSVPWIGTGGATFRARVVCGSCANYLAFSLSPDKAVYNISGVVSTTTPTTVTSTSTSTSRTSTTQAQVQCESCLQGMYFCGNSPSGNCNTMLSPGCYYETRDVQCMTQ